MLRRTCEPILNHFGRNQRKLWIIKIEFIAQVLDSELKKIQKIRKYQFIDS